MKDKILAILASEMGPAAARFLERQSSVRLKKTPDQITKADLAELTKWIGIGTELVLGKEAAARIVKKMQAL